MKFTTLSILTITLLFIINLSSIFIGIRGVKLIYILTFIIAFLYAIKKSFKYKLLYNAKYIISSCLLIFFYYIFNYGDKFMTLQLLSSYLFPLSVFIISYYTALDAKETFVIKNMKVLISLTTFPLLPFVIAGITQKAISKEFASDFFSTNSSLIIFWPFVFLTSSTSFAFSYFNPTKKIIYLIFYSIILLSIIFSAFTALFFMIVFMFLGYIYITSTKKNFFRIMLSIISAILLTILTLNFIGSGSVGELGGTAKKINAFLSLGKTSDASTKEDLLITATSGRWGSFSISIEYFLNSPLFGNGYYFDKSVIVSSQHSSILDNLAYFGLFSIIILMIYLKFLLDAYKLCSLSSNNNDLHKNAFIFGILFSFLLINIVNPYFYFHIINNIIFFLGGWVAGSLQTEKIQMKIAKLRINTKYK